MKKSKSYIIKRFVDGEFVGYVQDFLVDGSYWYWGTVPYEFDNLEEATFIRDSMDKINKYRGINNIHFTLVERAINEKEID